MSKNESVYLTKEENAEKNIKYYHDFKVYHVLTAALIFISMMIMIFSNDNPVILVSVYAFLVSMIACSKEKQKFITGFYYFIPIAILIIVINMFFVSSGSITLFYLFHKRFTLEAIVYAIIFSFKFLAVIYLFLVFESMIDTDRAVSYFSSVMPKSTLMLMISFKLIPSMKDRFKNLKEVYEIRGVKFNKKKSKEKTASYIPVLSILLEDSMEGSFSIGEAAYVRGFLSGNRSVYERQKFYSRDYKIIILSVTLIIFYGIAEFKNWVQFNIYDGVSIGNFINIGIAVIFALIVCITIFVIFNSEEKKDGFYRD